MLQVIESASDLRLEVHSSETDLPRLEVWKQKLGIGSATDDMLETGPDWDDTLRPYISRQTLACEYWKAKVEIPADCRYAFVDDPIYFEPLIAWLQERGIKVVALVHNIESLSGTQIRQGRQMRFLSRELELFRKCDLLVTISREETFLLQNLGCNVVFLPYFPIKAIRERLLEIRQERQAHQKHGLLMLGTAANSATAEGMRAVLRAWGERDAQRPRETLIVAGYGTEQLSDGNAPEGVTFLGTVSDRKLEQLETSVRAALCWQIRASGALTRVPELLIAGVPVIANSLAARSYYHLDGVIEINSLQDIGLALAAADQYNESGIPAVTQPDTDILLSALEAL